MLHNLKAGLLGAALLAPSVLAHISLKSPTPFGNPTTSPLSTDGSNFPCQVSDFTRTAKNNWAVGSQQTLEFSGTAVHGGGSCQIAVTTDETPSKASKWKVIYSIEGGCPGVSGSTSTFPMTVPKELPNGELSMAWTWFNHIGNREFYMNCAPISVTGGASDTSGFEKLPDMAIANIESLAPGCKTSEGSDYLFENPGEYKTKIGAGPFVPLCGGAAVPGAGTPGTPTAAPGAPAVSAPNNGLYTPPAGQAPVASQAPAVSSAPAEAPAPSETAPAALTSTVRTLVTITATGPAPSEPVATAPPTPTGAPSTGNGTACSNDGAIVCNGETQFGLCNHGTVVWQAVAAGTKCENGAIAKRHVDYTHRNQRARV